MYFPRISRGATIALAFLIFATRLPAFADEAADLLAKHKAFVGWQFGDGTFKTLKVDSQIIKTSSNAVDSTIHDIGINAAFRTTTHDKRGTYDDGFTGNIFWSSNINGFTRPVRGDVVKYLISSRVLFGEGITALMGGIRPTQTVDGQSLGVVRVAPEAGDPIDLYIVPATGELKRAVLDPDGTYERTIDILGYSDALPGKKIISKWKYSDSEYFHQNFKAVANEPVANDELHPPAQTARWKFANDQPFAIKFSDKDADPRIIVTAKVNGVEGRFILDTGASDILLARSFADRAGVKRLSAETFGGIGGSLKGEFAKADTVEIGGNTLTNVIVGAGGGKIDDEAPDGLMGFDLLAGAIVQVDLDNQKMTILDPKTHQANRDAGVTVAADLSEGIPYIPMKVDNRVMVNALLDSGAGTYVLFSTKLISDHGVRMLIDEGALASHMRIGGVGAGYETADCGNLESISVGPIIYDHAPACSVRGSVGDRDIIVGLDFLKGFNMVFDYPESYLILIPRH